MNDDKFFKTLLASSTGCDPVGTAIEDFKKLIDGYSTFNPEDEIKKLDDIKLPPEILDPNSPYNKRLDPITLNQLTEKDIEGKGVFDVLMYSIGNILRIQYESNKITGASYAEVFMNSIQFALQASIQFLLGKDQSYWQAVTAQIQAKRGLLDVTLAEYQIAQSKIGFYIALMQLENQEAQYALSKINIANAHVAYCLSEQQKILVGEQIDAARLQTKNTRSDGTAFEGIGYYQLESSKKDLLIKNEQLDEEMSKTKNMLSNGNPVDGTIKIQNDLYLTQIDGYHRQNEMAYISMLNQAWSVMKSIDEGQLPPQSFTISEMDKAMNKYKSNINLD